VHQQMSLFPKENIRSKHAYTIDGIFLKLKRINKDSKPFI
jgi:hypothetical protein